MTNEQARSDVSQREQVEDSVPAKRIRSAETMHEKMRNQTQSPDRAQADWADQGDYLGKRADSLDLRVKPVVQMTGDLLCMSVEAATPQPPPTAHWLMQGHHAGCLEQGGSTEFKTLKPDELLDTAIMEWQALCESVSARYNCE